ncbi:24636_t:CDS:1, partial [Dentiscutata erythropus]
MSRNKDKYYDLFNIFKDSKRKKRYRCQKCGNDWAKNKTRLQEHYKSCILVNSVKDTSSSGAKYQATVDNFVYKLSRADQNILESLFVCAFYFSEAFFNILENKNWKIFFSKACSAFKLPTQKLLATTLLNQKYKNINIVIQHLFNQT